MGLSRKTHVPDRRSWGNTGVPDYALGYAVIEFEPVDDYTDSYLRNAGLYSTPCSLLVHLTVYSKRDIDLSVVRLQVVHDTKTFEDHSYLHCALKRKGPSTDLVVQQTSVFYYEILSHSRW